MTTNWPTFLLERAARVPPAGARVIPGSTPVVSFGDPCARVATLSINPSSIEFMRRGSLLAGSERRLATLASLGVTKHEDINAERAATIVNECSSYFERRPHCKHSIYNSFQWQTIANL